MQIVFGTLILAIILFAWGSSGMTWFPLFAF